MPSLNGHETEHRWLRVRRHSAALKMVLDTTDHQISPRMKKTHYFNTVLQERCPTTVEWLQAWVLSPVNAVRWIIDQVHLWTRSHACRLRRIIDINVLRFCANIIHDGLVEPADYKIDRTACLDNRVVWHYHVIVPVAIGGSIWRKSIVWGGRLPRAKANGGILRRRLKRLLNLRNLCLQRLKWLPIRTPLCGCTERQTYRPTIEEQHRCHDHCRVGQQAFHLSSP